MFTSIEVVAISRKTQSEDQFPETGKLKSEGKAQETERKGLVVQWAVGLLGLIREEAS